jgi:hypothetical protein
MKRAFGRAGGTVALLALSAPCHQGCESGPYTGGRCAAFEDCHSSSQAVPGTICVDESCICEDRRLVICCAPGDEAPGCQLACRPCEACNRDTLDANDRTKCDLPACDEDSDCDPAPAEASCSIGKCEGGKCTLAIRTGPLPNEAQTRGDCTHLECSEDGEIVAVDDPYDTYDDGKECTVDLCDHGTRINAPLPSLVCPVTGVGRCHEGACVECLASDPTTNDCTGGRACDGVLCVPPHCVNASFEPVRGETYVDCGGPCKPCNVGERCVDNEDCESGVCKRDACQPSTCDDGVQNGDETDVDCGARTCLERCKTEQGCKESADCKSGVCWAGRCE